MLLKSSVYERICIQLYMYTNEIVISYIIFISYEVIIILFSGIIIL